MEHGVSDSSAAHDLAEDNLKVVLKQPLPKTLHAKIRFLSSFKLH